MSARNKSISEPEQTLDARLRALPSVTAVLNTAAAVELVQRFGRMISTEAVRVTVDGARTAIKAGATEANAAYIAHQTLSRLVEPDRSNLRPRFKLTRAVRHSNL